MARGLWCEDPDKGHAFDERETIIVDPDGTPQFFCKSHAIRAFAVAFHLADIAGSAGIVVPALGGAFTVIPAGAQPTPGAPAGDGTGQRDEAPDRSKPGTAAAGEHASPAAPGTEKQRHARATRSARALADLIEQEPRPGSRTPVPMSYGQRA
jgi:hypothetical protein